MPYTRPTPHEQFFTNIIASLVSIAVTVIACAVPGAIVSIAWTLTFAASTGIAIPFLWAWLWCYVAFVVVKFLKFLVTGM